KDPDELREAAAEALAILGATPARPVLDRIAQSKKEDERVRAAAQKAAQTIAQKGPSNATPARPTPALPLPPMRPPAPAEAPWDQGRALPVATPMPFTIIGTPRPQAALSEEPVVVGEEPLWQDEPPRRKQPAPEIAALLADYLAKTDDPVSKPLPIAQPAPPEQSGTKLAAVQLVKKKQSDHGDDNQ